MEILEGVATHEKSVEFEEDSNKEYTEEVGDSARVGSQPVAPADNKETAEKAEITDVLVDEPNAVDDTSRKELVIERLETAECVEGDVGGEEIVEEAIKKDGVEQAMESESTAIEVLPCNTTLRSGLTNHITESNMAVKKDIAIATNTVTEATMDIVTEGSTELEIETETASEAGTVTKNIIDHGILPRVTQSIQNPKTPKPREDEK